LPAAKEAKTVTMTAAAAVMTRPVRAHIRRGLRVSAKAFDEGPNAKLVCVAVG
jgi:hypothetical protein